MRLRVVFALVIALGLMSQPAFAQLEFGGGAKGGIAFSKVSSDEPLIQDSFNEQRLGVVLGGFVTIPLNERFVIQPEVLFVQKGSSGSDDDGADLTLELDYVEIPILANIRFPTGGNMVPFVFTGPVPAFNTAAKAKASIGGQDQEEQLDDDFKSLDFLWTVGGGLQFQNLTIEGRYTFGLGAADEESLGASDDLKNRTFAILFGIILG